VWPGDSRGRGDRTPAPFGSTPPPSSMRVRSFSDFVSARRAPPPRDLRREHVLAPGSRAPRRCTRLLRRRGPGAEAPAALLRLRRPALPPPPPRLLDSEQGSLPPCFRWAPYLFVVSERAMVVARRLSALCLWFCRRVTDITVLLPCP
jgi:hypothetical protein